MSIAATSGLPIVAGCRLRNAPACQGTRRWERRCTPCQTPCRRHRRTAPGQSVLDWRRGAPVRRAAPPASARVSRGGRLPRGIGPDARAGARARLRARGDPPEGVDAAAEYRGPGRPDGRCRFAPRESGWCIARTSTPTCSASRRRACRSQGDRQPRGSRALRAGFGKWHRKVEKLNARLADSVAANADAVREVCTARRASSPRIVSSSATGSIPPAFHFVRRAALAVAAPR